MPVTITAVELAAAIRVSASLTEPLDEPTASLMGRILAASTEAVEGYIPNGGPTDATYNLAVAMMAQTLYDNPESRNPMERSGALSILAPYRIPSTGKVV